MKKNTSLALLLCVLPFAFTSAQTEYLPKKNYKAYRIEQAPVINGAFDDPAWEQGEWAGGFIQNEPYENRPPSQPTEFKIAYDDTYLYVAIKALDDAPDSITSRMSRRDNGDGDMVFVVFDSYHDLRTGFTFGVSSAGVRFDMIFSNNGQVEDPTWDPIWQAKAQIHSWGWGAEMKIPFTQLRFEKNSTDIWGFDVARQIFRKNEMSLWHPIPRNAPGIIHAMGTLDGLQEIEPRKQLDLTPYGVSSVRSFEAEEGNPFATGREFNYDLGLDGKIGVTNNLTLDFTINPDFGQVEADPSEVNLSAFETFFEEKRPFFIEGNNITSFNVGLGDGDIGNDNLFYSRRIGRRPQGYPSLEDGEYADVPSFTRILGAGKLTGKTANGLSVGVLEVLTADTRAVIDNDGTRRKESVEPLTNYSLARVQKDFNKGNTIIGGAATNMIRQLENSQTDWLHKNASSAGVDFTQFFKDRNYTLNASLFFSNVQGSEEAISNTQRSSARYFQRPDAPHLALDDTRTSLSGFGGKLDFGKIGGNWNFLFMNLFKSPGFEINDMGYMRNTDKILNVLWTGYNFTEPFSIFRNLQLNTDVYMVSNFGREIEGFGYEYNINAGFKNFWFARIGGGFEFRQYSTDILRGGPGMDLPNTSRLNFNVSTDDRKVVSSSISGSLNSAADDAFTYFHISAGATIRPMNTLAISLFPAFAAGSDELQYIDYQEMEGNPRYLFGHIDQKTLSMSIRINYNLTPDLTIQYWGQPFIACGSYTRLKRITDPRADRFTDRFVLFSDEQLTYADGAFLVDENLDLSTDYVIENPDFTVDEWLSNLVVRWEFLPGSTAYLVWSQSRDYYISEGGFNVWDNLNNLYTDKKASNTILLKFSWRFGLR